MSDNIAYAHAEALRHKKVWEAQVPEFRQTLTWLGAMETQGVHSDWFRDFIAAHEGLLEQVRGRCTEGVTVMEKFALMLLHTDECYADLERRNAARQGR